jgi:SAM-dependent methyltransferase
MPANRYLSAPSCPICGDSAHKRLTSAIVASRPIYRCNRCGGFFLHPPIDVQYDNSGWTSMREAQWARDVHTAQIHAARIAEWFARCSGKQLRSVLEIGCGTGFMGAGFAKLGIPYLGTDLDAQSIQFARERHINVVLTPAETLCSALPKLDFDLVLSSNTFEHVESQPQSFASLRQLSFIRAVIIVPNALGILPRAKGNPHFRTMLRTLTGSTRDAAYTIDGHWHNVGITIRTLDYLCRQSSLAVSKLRTMSVNDPVWGFVQRNDSLVYRLFDSAVGLLGMHSEIKLELSAHQPPNR